MTDPNRVADRQIKRVDVHSVLAAMLLEEGSAQDGAGYSPATAGAAGGLAIEGSAGATGSTAAPEIIGDQPELGAPGI